MAIVAYEGFDHYGTASDALLSRRGGGLQWNTGGVAFLSPGRNGSGLAVGVGQNGNVQAALTVPLQAGYLGFGMLLVTQNYPGSPVLYLTDLITGTTQLRILFNIVTGGIEVYRGPSSPWTLLGRSSNNAFTVNAWNFIEISASIANAGGAVQVRSNGQIVLDVAGIDTQAGGNAQFDGLWFYGPGAPTGTTIYIDDLYVADTAIGPGLFPMNYFLGDIRVVTLHPIANYGTPGWTPFVPPLSPHRFWRLVVNAGAPSVTNDINEIQFRTTAGVPEPLTGGTASATGGTASLAADNNPATEFSVISWRPFYWQYDFGVGRTHLPAEIAITCGLIYQNAPTAFDLLWSDDGIGFTYYNSYVAEWQNGTQTKTWGVGESNWRLVDEARADGDFTYNTTATVGAADRFGFEQLGPTISSVLAIQVTGAYRKDDSGTRIVTQLVNSGGTEVGGSGFSVPNSYVYCSDLYTTDPHTGASWTAAAVNALKVGYVLSS